MKNRFNHIIKTQSVEISFEDIEDSIGIQNRIAEVFYDKLQPRMNALFDEIAGEKYLMTIDRLEIDSGVLLNKNWEDEWVDNTIRELKNELIAKNRKQFEERSVYAKEIENYFFFFLEHGHLPWNCRVDSLLELEDHIIFNTGFAKKMKELIDAVENAGERLVRSFSETFRDKLIKTVIKNSTWTDDKIYSTIRSSAGYNDPVFQMAVLKLVVANEKNNDPEMSIEKIRNLRKELLQPVNKKEKGDRRKTQVQQPKNQKETESIFINNAGLIILHPFLPQLFETTGLIKEKQWFDETSGNRAVTMLQYLVTGKNEFAEFGLTLNKILCGIDPAEVSNKEEELTAFAKKECEDLLSEVIRYWSVLKNTGTDALRETFLQRNGKLSGVDDGWLLQVEQKSVDILLGSLPWGIGTIKLPWMKDVIYTEWV